MEKPASYETRATPTYNVWGFKLIDSHDDVMIEQQWRNQGFEWVTQEIPDGWEVIGFYGDTT